MAMPHDLHEMLKEVCADKKYKEDGLLLLLVDTYDKAEAKDKVQEANTGLIAERDELKNKLKDLKSERDTMTETLKAKEAEVDKLKESSLTDEEKKAYLAIKEKGMTSDVEAKINSLTEKIETLTTQVTEEQSARELSEKAAIEAKRAERVGEVKSLLTTELGKNKISGENARLALTVLETDALFKVDAKEDGSYESKFFTKKDGKFFGATAEELAKHFAETHENLVDSSGNIGSGNNHSNSDTGYTPRPTYQNYSDALNAAEEMINSN
jgi:2-hydroxy-3-keto-5-methylthiopentenyl-1-phosphate phosphatase